MSAVPSTSSTTTLSSTSLAPLGDMNGVSGASAEQVLRKKRSQSLGGAEDLAAMRLQKKQKPLSPAKLARRSLAPRRSILKQPGGSGNTTVFDQTGTYSGRPSVGAPAGGGVESSDEEEDMDFTRAYGGGENTTMALRRVSFAPNAHIRTFSPAKRTALAQAETSFSSTDDTDASFASSSAEQSMEMAEDTTAAFAAHFSGGGAPGPLDDGQQEEEQYEGEYEEEEMDENEDEDEDAMEMADPNEVTSAFANNPGRRVSMAPSLGAKTAPRFSEVVRSQDAEDEEILRQLQAAPSSTSTAVAPQSPAATATVAPASARAAPRFSAVVRAKDQEDEEIRKELEDIKKQAEAMATSHGQRQVEEEQMQDAAEESGSDDDEEEADEVAMDLTMSVGRVLARPSLGGALTPGDGVTDGEDDMEDEDEDVSAVTRQTEDLTGRTREMSLEDEDVTSASVGMDLTSTTQTAMVEATSYGRIFSSRQSISAAHLALSQSQPAPQTPAERRRQDHLFRRLSLTGALPAMASPKLGSPRRVARPSTGLPPPPQSPRRASSLVSTYPPISPTLSPVRELPARSSSRSPSKSERRKTLSPVKKPTTPSRSPGVRKMAPMSVGRSPGGSLSLRGLLQEQLAARGVAGGQEDTGSTFGEESQPKISLNQFFEESGTGFMKDVLGMTGVDLVDKRRKSMATFRQPSGPPTFADLAVAGACKALFHQLYQSDQHRLQEDIQFAAASLGQLEEAVNQDQPEIFAEWASASEERRAAMTAQFRMIKSFYYLSGRVDWNVTRSENHASIISVMEDSLEGLRADNEVLANTSFDDVLPGLQQRKAALLKELQEEQARDLELSSCDQETLAELHAALAEQDDQIKYHQSELAEKQEQLSSLTLRADEFGAQEAKLAEEKQVLRKYLDDGHCFTKAEVVRLTAEHDALQHLHGWKLIQFTSTAVKIRHLNEFDVVLQVHKGAVYTADVALVSDLPPGLSGDLTQFLFAKLVLQVEALMEHYKKSTLQPKFILSHIAALWTSARRIRHEMLFAKRRYPTTATEYDTALHVTSEVHLPQAKATVNVIFEITGEELLGPTNVDTAVARIGCDVELVFGRADVEGIKYTVRERMDGGGRRAVVEALDAVEAMYSK